MTKEKIEMGSAATVRSEPSGYFLQSAAIRPVTERTAKFGGRQRLAIAPTVVSDLSLIYPEAVVASSQPLGWQNLRALEMRQASSEWTMPPLANHCIVVQLGPSVAVTARIGDQNFEQSLEPGAITIVPAGLSVDWQQEDTASHTLHLYLNPQFLRTTAESIDVDYSQISIAPQFGIRDEHIHHIGMSLRHELKDSNVIARLYADSLAKVLAMQLVRRYSYLKDLQTSRGGMAPRKLRKAIEFINNNLDQEQTVTVSALAEAVQMSYFHFSRAFKQSMGSSPYAYMTEQRIARAKKLLSETDLPIVDIALRAGFANQSHFTTTFGKLVWTTPKAFRDTQ
jgi:AraC family transcriptional regulator